MEHLKEYEVEYWRPAAAWIREAEEASDHFVGASKLYKKGLSFQKGAPQVLPHTTL